MTKKTRNHVEDLRGATKLAIEATRGVAAVVEEMHRTIGAGPAILGRPLETAARVVTGVAYGSFRGATSLVGAGLDAALEQLTPLLGDGTPGPEREAVVAALNAVLGDYLAETDNPLATKMCLRHEAQPLELEEEAMRAVAGKDPRKLLVMVHGLGMSDHQWCRSGHDHGTALARDLGYGLIYLHYNSGRHISTNGSEFAVLLDQLVSTWPTPLEELVLVGYSMGGLVSRSACSAAENLDLAWRKKLRAIVFVGTPHHGAPLERGGNWADVLLGVSSYSAPLARLGKIRSAGITDLRFGSVLDEHWSGRDRFEFGDDPRTPLPLPDGVACYAVAGIKAGGVVGELSGDGVVPVDSALGRHKKPELTLAFPEERKWVSNDTSHLELLDRTSVFETIRDWLTPASSR